MCFRRRSVAALVVAIVASSVASLAAAAEPAHPVPARPTVGTPPTAERPLTPAEQAASRRRIELAEAHAARFAASGADLLSLACVVPQSGTSRASTQAVTQSCSPPQGFLGVEARDQLFGHYCGPAVGQVIANFSWAMGPGANKHSQARIADWMGTDANGQTTAPYLEDGLEAATMNAPRRPSGWDWVVTDLRDRNGDRSTGDELHGYIRSNISVSRMPMAIPVKPHDRLSQYNLPSWPQPVPSPGHWIGIYGWLGLWNGGDTARSYYTDSSRDEGGATGKFWLPTRHLAMLVGEHTQRFVW
jgi:hypothetical protein